MKRSWKRKAPLLALIALAASVTACWFPEEFEVEIEIDEKGRVEMTYEGILGFLPVRAEVLAGKLLSRSDMAKIDEISEELQDDGGCSSARHVGAGRFAVRCEREGTTRSAVEFLSSELSIFQVRPVGGGVVEFGGTEIGSDDLAKLKQIGIQMKGRVRLRVEGEVLEHNAQKEPSLLALRSYYEWNIDSLDDPRPFLRLRMEGAVASPAEGEPDEGERVAVTMSKLRTLATVIESYSIDHDEYPRVPRGSVESLRGLVEPTYIKTLPVDDGWGHPMEVIISDDAQEYWLVSRGSDGLPGGPRQGRLQRTEDDIIFSTGSFLTWHEIEREQPSRPRNRSQRPAQGPEHQTMGLLRTIATAIESYSIDYNEYPRVPRGSVESLRGLVEPTYIRTLPVDDGWGHPMEVIISDDAQEYWLVSRGSDGRPGGPKQGRLQRTEDDIIFSTGSFVTWHEIERERSSRPRNRSQRPPLGPEYQTMGLLRTIATAIESYSIDHDEYPRVPRGSVESLRGLVEPTYIKTLPVDDGWGHPMEVVISDDAQEYWLVSRGSDGRPGGPREGRLQRSEDDIIFSTGSFVTWHPQR